MKIFFQIILNQILKVAKNNIFWCKSWCKFDKSYFWEVSHLYTAWLITVLSVSEHNFFILKLHCSVVLWFYYFQTKIPTVPNFSRLSWNQAPCPEVPKYNKLVPNSSFFSTVEENPKFLFFNSPKSLFFHKLTPYSTASSTTFKYFKSWRWCLFKKFSSSVHLYLENLLPSI